ncbi:MAG TPA: hypothetical protein VM370_00735 [Candidatus Thermoplasmatota archaeon]|nr:hypothetical protein [Candidatus Thermoplasmatota archaeon]
MRALVLALALLVALPLAPAAAPTVSRDDQPVVILGAQLPMFAVVANYVERPPALFAEEEQDGVYLPLPAVVGQPAGAPVDALRGRAWDGATFHEIPFQVDERFVRYLTNYASGFGIYSQADMELGYAFDIEGVRKTGEVPGQPDVAAFDGAVTTPDPVPGLDSDDEVVFLWGDAGPRAPSVPAGATELAILDPLSQETRYVYVDIVQGDQPRPYVTAGVEYARDADADLYIQSNHGDYGGAPGGTCHEGDGVDAPLGPAVAGCSHRRPKDSATVTTPRYQFHYAGRWKMDGIRVAEGDSFSDSLVDRWKGRAFQQREGNAADIGGFEDENDWTKSSVTLGEKVGPVRALRETWGADSGTSVTRLDVFYPAGFDQVYHMRVHPIPPDGVYAFWDHSAGMVDTYYTSVRSDGVPIDGVGDEIYGTNSEWQEDALGETLFLIDAPDPTLSGAVANEAWDEATGAHGTILTYIHALRSQSGVLTPYYRDDATFFDGTGTEPGSYGAHGIHFFFTGDTDNLFLPVPTDEFVAEVHQAILPGRAPNVGAAFRATEAAPFLVTAAVSAS